MIVTFTDYGQQGPYVGLLHHAIHRVAPAEKVIDLMHDAPQFDIRAASCLLAALAPQFEKGAVFLAVVDPGVGGQRKPVVLRTSSQVFVGPHNGLFDGILLGNKNCSLQQIDISGFEASDSFHGRDIFAPVAAAIASGQPWSEKCQLPATPIMSETTTDWPAVIYIDGFGNAMTGIGENILSSDAIIEIAGQTISFARTFSEVQNQALFWYRNSIGLVEIAANKASAAKLLSLQLGTTIHIQ